MTVPPLGHGQRSAKYEEITTRKNIEKNPKPYKAAKKLPMPNPNISLRLIMTNEVDISVCKQQLKQAQNTEKVNNSMQLSLHIWIK